MTGEARLSIDVAIPFHGRLELLQEAVLSVLAQTDPAWRLLVVDDNEPVAPETAAWLSSLDDERVEYLPNERNLGVSASFNRCVEVARADHVTIMGCDDRLLPDYVAHARTALAAVGPVVAYHPQVRVIDEHGEPARPATDRVKAVLRPSSSARRVVSGEMLAARLMHGTWTYFPAMCWSRAILARHRFSTDQLVVQDTRLLVDLVMAGGSVCLDPVTTFEYRRHGEAASSRALTTGARFVEEKTFYEQYAVALDDLGWSRAARNARWHLTSRLNAGVVAAGLVRRGAVTSAWQLVRRHVLARPRTGNGASARRGPRT